MNFPAFLVLILVGVIMVGESDSAPMNIRLNPSGSKVEEKWIKQAAFRLKGETSKQAGLGVQSKDSETPMQADYYNDYIDCCFSPLSKCCREQRTQSGSTVQTKVSEIPMPPIDCCFDRDSECCRKQIPKDKTLKQNDEHDDGIEKKKQTKPKLTN